VRIVFLGNFSVPYSTESHHRCTWEKLGHEVVALQENRATTDEVVRACQGAQLLQVTHTHGWPFGGSITPEEMLQRIHEMGVRTFSYHLDVYWGLNTVDRREENIGRHWSWKVQRFFSTVDGRDAEFKARGVDHCWLRPGVVEYGTEPGTFQPGLAVDVGFAGSVGYHPEYPFRSRLVGGLRDRYGPRFRVFNGYRERALNDLYASVKVVVGDHCFAGQGRYWSDRAPETCGRGGFLLYPSTEGMCIPTATYRPQDLDDLFAKVDHYLAHDAEREAIRKSCHAHVKSHDTYTVILQEILRIMGCREEKLACA